MNITHDEQIAVAFEIGRDHGSKVAQGKPGGKNPYTAKELRDAYEVGWTYGGGQTVAVGKQSESPSVVSQGATDAQLGGASPSTATPPPVTIKKGSIVKYKDGHMRVTAVFKQHVNLGPVFAGKTTLKKIYIGDVTEDGAGFHEQWSKSEAYQSM